MSNSFSFQLVSDDAVSMVIIDMDSAKAYQKNNIPPSLLKVNVDVIKSILRDDINVNIVKGNFPAKLKNADITPIFKKLSAFFKPITGQSVFYPCYQRFMRKYFINK